MAIRRIRRTAAQWHAIVEEQVASGLNPTAFCDSTGIAYQSFMKWRSRLNKFDERPSDDKSTFVELTTDPISLPVKDTVSGAPATGVPVLVELSLGGGIELRITHQQ